jgi:hypothetical protein
LPIFVALLGLSAATTSILLWERDYSRHFGHFDADDFGMYARALAAYLTKPDARTFLKHWLRAYPHLHNPLGPALMALPIALGFSAERVYLFFSSVCSFASLWVLFRVLRDRLGVTYRTSVLVLALCGSHALFLRSFARPVTDALGYLLTILLLDSLLAVVVRRSARTIAALGILGLLETLARPQGLAYLPFVTGGALLCAYWRDGRFEIRQALCTICVVLVLPVASFLALSLVFSWSASLRAQFALAARFRSWNSLHDFVSCLVFVVQLLPVLWLLPPWRAWNRRYTLLTLWAAYYLAMLVAVRASFWARYFLPMLPTVMTLTARALDKGTARRLAIALVALLAGANVLLVVYWIFLRSALGLTEWPFPVFG